MRVLLVHNYYRIRAGEDVVVEQELAMLRRAGVDARLFAVHNAEMQGGAAELATGLTTVYNPWSRRALARELAAFAPDVVHVHNFFPRLSPSVFDACRDAATPVVLTLHNLRIVAPQTIGSTEIPDAAAMRRSAWRMVPGRTYRGSWAASLALAAMVEFHKARHTWRDKVDRFIVLSPPAKALFVAGGIPEEKIVVKPNCVTGDSPCDRLEDRDGALFIGRLDEQKGIRTLLSAWERLDYPLKVIGAGPLAELVANCGNPHVTYLGPRSHDEVLEAMRRARMLVFPSMAHEMFPLTVTEAFAHRLPVIASALPSLTHLVVGNETGLVFPPGDAAALADRVTWALRHPEALDAMRGRAHREYLENYTPEANTAALIRLYESLAPLRAAGAPHRSRPARLGAEDAYGA